MAIKVKLRKKSITGNRHSLYLDFYPAIEDAQSGKLTRRQFLGYYLYDRPKNNTEKKHNEETLKIAEQMRQKRDNELSKPEIYTAYEKDQLREMENSEMSFIAYFKQLANERRKSNHDNWISAYKYLDNFAVKDITFAKVNEKFCNDFKRYLLTVPSNKSSKATLSQNSAVSYFNKVKAALKQAYKDGLLKQDLNAKIETIKQAETQRNFLTLEELTKLAKTETTNKTMKNAALFSALTGLRYSDIVKLTWEEIEHIEGQGYFIRFQQQKTKGMETMPISDQAYSFLGERKGPLDKVFYTLCDRDRYYHFPIWVSKAGITKDITFHCLRHTFATLQLSQGTDIYTVSKMLGHRELKTTQVYAKIIDETKRKAANKIKIEL
jgi:integrase